MSKKINQTEISVIGGAGHVGFPLGIVFAGKKNFTTRAPLNTTYKRIGITMLLYWSSLTEVNRQE